MTEVEVTLTGRDDRRLSFEVRLRDPGSATSHRVTLETSDLTQLGGGEAPEGFVERCFRFLLEREPKESILRSFDVAQIGDYFPDFRERIRSRG